jgi:hypothetical protein
MSDSKHGYTTNGQARQGTFRPIHPWLECTFSPAVAIVRPMQYHAAMLPCWHVLFGAPGAGCGGWWVVVRCSFLQKSQRIGPRPSKELCTFVQYSTSAEYKCGWLCGGRKSLRPVRHLVKSTSMKEDNGPFSPL